MYHLNDCRFLTFFITLLLTTLSASAQVVPEWKDPEIISVNTEKGRADFVPYANEKSALQLDKKSPFVRSLNGIWKFKWASHPSKAPSDFFKPTFSTANWDNIPVPSNWQVAGREKDAHTTNRFLPILNILSKQTRQVSMRTRMQPDFTALRLMYPKATKAKLFLFSSAEFSRHVMYGLTEKRSATMKMA